MSRLPYYSDESVTLHHGDALAVLRTLPDQAVDCAVTSPPYYGLRDYGVTGQLGLEASPAEYAESLRLVFAEVRRVLAEDGTLWLNLGDSYYSGRGNPGPNAADEKNAARRGWVRPVDRPGQTWGRPKSLLGIPWRVAFALQDDGWILRNAVIWAKPNAMPESVTDRLSCRYETVFLFSRSRRYWFDLDPIRERHLTADRVLIPALRGSQSWSANATLGQPQQASGTGGVGRSDIGRNPGDVWSINTHGAETRPVYDGPDGLSRERNRGGRTDGKTVPAESGGLPGNPNGRNPGDVWSINTRPFAAAHFACMPVTLAERCIQAGCKPGGTVLDPFSGSGTTGLAAARHGRRYVGIDLNREYLDLSLRTRLAQSQMSDGVA